MDKVTVKLKEKVTNLNLDGHKSTEKFYFTWNNMWRRCSLSDTGYKQWQRYSNCTVDDEWLSFDSFYNWCEKNYYEVPGCRMELDKDLLVKGNRIYAPDRCCFLPSELNNILTYHKSNKGELPVGVSRYKDKFKAQLSGIGCLGIFDTVDESFHVYKEAKEKRIKETAEKYREWIPSKAYEKLINWTVEIDD